MVAIVEDDARVRVALERLLRTCGYAVQSFVSGDAFLTDRNRHAADCVVLDLHMSGASGFDVQRQLQSEGRVVPVVAITGQDSPGARERAMAAGACAYLCKPIDREDLTSAIEDAIRRSAGTEFVRP
jgi:FixJ family two-component response regulator